VIRFIGRLRLSGQGHIKRIKDQVRAEREEMLLALSAKQDASITKKV